MLSFFNNIFKNFDMIEKKTQDSSEQIDSPTFHNVCTELIFLDVT